MRLTWSVPVVGGALLVGLALALPGRPGPDGEAARATAGILAVAVAVLGAVVVAIAWRAREWGPALLALMCFSAAAGPVGSVLFGANGIGRVELEGAGELPALGLIAGGTFAAAASVPYRATTQETARGPRALLAGAAVAICAGMAVLLVWPGMIPGDGTMRVLAGVAGAGYVAAGMAFASSYRLLRLLPPLTIAGGALALAGAVPFVSAGGVAGVPHWAFDVGLIAVTALPAAGFVAEHRVRPGLRTLALGLFLPTAVSRFRTGGTDQLGGILEMISATDAELEGHLDRVGQLSVRLGEQIGMPASELAPLVTAARCHDIGKIYIPRAILEKPGDLAAEDYAIVRRHAALGEALATRALGDPQVARVVGEHHERWDGEGYPAGKRNEEITLAGRVVMVADAYDALVNRPCYKQAWSPRQALEQIRRDAGGRFDPWVVDALEEVIAPRVYAPRGPVEKSA